MPEPLNDLRVAVLGNVDPDVWWSTENEYIDAWTRAGATVEGFHEKHPGDWHRLIDRVAEFDLVQWTSTRDFSVGVGSDLQWRLATRCAKAGVPLVGVHLDIWFGFKRAADVDTLPYFQACDVLFTADGGNRDEWEARDINHRWLLPAISERWLGVGTPQQKYRSKIAFTGSWEGGYHPEAEHRHQLVAWLQENYGDDVRFYPKAGQPRIHGLELNDLYASVDVVVGDSAVLPGKGFYCSDRVPEVLGRGGILTHPWVEGVCSPDDAPYDPDRLLGPFVYVGWEQGDWAELATVIERLLDLNPFDQAIVRENNVDWIADRHTYTHRCFEIVDALADEGMIHPREEA